MSETAVDLLAQVREMALSAYMHQDIPFEKLVAELQPDRDLKRTPFFQMMFILQNAPMSTVEMPGVNAESVIQVESFALNERLAQYDLTTVMWETDGVLEGVIEYKTALFAPETVAQFCTHFVRILEAIVAEPKRQIDAIPLLAQSEVAQLQATQQGQTVSMPPQAVHQLFEETAVSHPQQLALETPKLKLSYDQLNQRANQLAHFMRAQQITSGDVIAVLLPRSPEALTAMLATLKVGAAYLMLDPAYPTERIQTMLADALPKLLLTHSAYAQDWEDELTTIALDAVDDSLADCPTHNLDLPYQPEQPAYLIYTSGSTGKPKGVLVPHRALTNHCVAMADEFVLTSADRVLQFASLSFDVAAEEIFPTWARGATLVLRPDELPLSFTEFVAEQDLHVLNLPAAYWHDWVAQSHSANQPVPDCVRLMVVGSEKVLPSRLAQWLEIAPTHCRWLNAYGPTETAVTATIFDPAGEVYGEAAVPIGRPIANVTTYVFDVQLNLVPRGVTGELYIGGEGLALGYLNRPDLTEQAFIIHPETGERLYKTGDLVRRSRSGDLAFVGRADNQVKVRGFRIELGEIEAVLREHAQVDDCLLIAHEEPEQPMQLIAYCVTQVDVLNATEMRQYLQTQLPSYMIPASFIFISEFRYTANGKIDRRALPTPTTQEIAAYVPPSTEREMLVAGIWADVLQKPQVGLYDNFFDLGGHSLLATQIVSRIRQAIAVEVPIRMLFEAPTVGDFVNNLPEVDLFG